MWPFSWSVTSCFVKIARVGVHVARLSGFARPLGRVGTLSPRLACPRVNSALRVGQAKFLACGSCPAMKCTNAIHEMQLLAKDFCLGIPKPHGPVQEGPKSPSLISLLTVLAACTLATLHLCLCVCSGCTVRDLLSAAASAGVLLGGSFFFLQFHFTGTFHPFCVISGVVSSVVVKYLFFFQAQCACVCECVQECIVIVRRVWLRGVLCCGCSPNTSALRAFEAASLLLGSRSLLP